MVQTNLLMIRAVRSLNKTDTARLNCYNISKSVCGLVSCIPDDIVLFFVSGQNINLSSIAKYTLITSNPFDIKNSAKLLQVVI